MGNFDWVIWGKKLARKALFGIVVGGLVEVSAFLGTEPVPTEYAWITVAGVLGIEMILNAIKHSWKD